MWHVNRLVETSGWFTAVRVNKRSQARVEELAEKRNEGLTSRMPN